MKSVTLGLITSVRPLNAVITPPLIGKRRIVMSVSLSRLALPLPLPLSVCVCVCVFVCLRSYLRKSGTTRPIFTNFCACYL